MFHRSYVKHIIDNTIKGFKEDIENQNNMLHVKTEIRYNNNIIKKLILYVEKIVDKLPYFTLALKEHASMKKISNLCTIITHQAKLNKLIPDRFCNKSNHCQKDLIFTYFICKGIDLIQYFENWTIIQELEPKTKNDLINKLRSMINQIKPMINYDLINEFNQLDASDHINTIHCQHNGTIDIVQDQLDETNEIIHCQPEETIDNSQDQLNETNEGIHYQPEESNDDNQDQLNETNDNIQYQPEENNDNNQEHLDEINNLFQYDLFHSLIQEDFENQDDDDYQFYVC